jgi:hypothetical protein
MGSETLLVAQSGAGFVIIGPEAPKPSPQWASCSSTSGGSTSTGDVAPCTANGPGMDRPRTACPAASTMLNSTASSASAAQRGRRYDHRLASASPVHEGPGAGRRPPRSMRHLWQRLMPQRTGGVMTAAHETPDQRHLREDAATLLERVLGYPGTAADWTPGPVTTQVRRPVDDVVFIVSRLLHTGAGPSESLQLSVLRPGAKHSTVLRCPDDLRHWSRLNGALQLHQPFVAPTTES